MGQYLFIKLLGGLFAEYVKIYLKIQIYLEKVNNLST